MNRAKPRVRRLLLVLLAAVLALLSSTLGAPATADSSADRPSTQRVGYTEIDGTGSTWSQLIVAQWIADVASTGMKVVYTGGGSTKGRKDFALGSTDFAISEIPYQGKDEQGNSDTSNGRDFAYLPIVAGGTSFTYQLKIGNEQVRNLRLSGETLTKIFTGKITNWNDDAITADNNGREFPDLDIIPVVRSDGSGTTAQFTTWMDKVYPSLWRPYFGKSGLTSYYPKNVPNMIGQSGSDQVMNAVKSAAGNGTIGYVEYSYATAANYPVVKVLNKAGYYVEPTKYNVAVALTKAKINTTDKNNPSTYLTQILDGVYTNPDSRAYPISSYSYMILPTGADDPKMTTAKRQTLADFMYYSLCAGQGKAGDYGYSPLPLNLVQAGFNQIAKLKTADPAVDLTDRDVRSCNNPTFDGKNPNRNLLADIAPPIAACDKQGAGPCTTGTGTGAPSTDAANGGAPVDTDGDGTPDAAAPDPGSPDDPSSPGSSPGADDGSTGDQSAPGSSAPQQTDPETGQVVDAAPGTDDTAAADGSAIYPSSTLVSDRPLDSKTFGWVAVVELLALVLLPGLVVSSFRRRRNGGRA